MALVQCNFFSNVLGLQCSMNVILPENTGSKPGSAEMKTLYLLHGYSDDHSAWVRNTSIERYVEGLNLAVVMPAVNKSYYTDALYGDKYWTFISEELPTIARSFFRLSDKREDNFVAGLSMGGYGAFKLALSKPGNFAAAASLSGAVDLVKWVNESDNVRHDDWVNIFGGYDKVKGSCNDLFHLAQQAAAAGIQLPKLYQWCGTEDFLYKGNLNFKKLAEELQLDHIYEEGPGDHAWKYWDRQIQRVLEWMQVK